MVFRISFNGLKSDSGTDFGQHLLLDHANNQSAMQPQLLSTSVIKGLVSTDTVTSSASADINADTRYFNLTGFFSQITHQKTLRVFRQPNRTWYMTMQSGLCVRRLSFRGQVTRIIGKKNGAHFSFSSVSFFFCSDNVPNSLSLLIICLGRTSFFSSKNSHSISVNMILQLRGRTKSHNLLLSCHSREKQKKP